MMIPGSISIGSRISYQGFNFKNSLLDKQEYHSVHADLLWNVLGTLYREDNELRWNLFPFVGVGMIHNKTNKHNQAKRVATLLVEVSSPFRYL